MTNIGVVNLSINTIDDDIMPIIDFVGEAKTCDATSNPVPRLGCVEHRKAACRSINASFAHGAMHRLDDVPTLTK